MKPHLISTSIFPELIFPELIFPEKIQSSLIAGIKNAAIADPTVIRQAINLLKRELRHSPFSVNRPSNDDQEKIQTEASKRIELILDAITYYLANVCKEEQGARVINKKIKQDAEFLTEANHLIRLYQMVNVHESNPFEYAFGTKIRSLFQTIENLKALKEKLFNSSGQTEVDNPLQRNAKKLYNNLAVYAKEACLLVVKENKFPGVDEVPTEQIVDIGNSNSKIRLVSGKVGGQNSSGPRGGVHFYQGQGADVGQGALIKRDTKKNKPRYDKVISEYISGALIDALCQESGEGKISAQVTLVKLGEGSENVYLILHLI